MPAVQYPFIDIAVHARVKDRFARGEAIVLFSVAMDRVLWANGAGARLFGNPGIYDFLEEGPNRNDVTFRQMEATARQLGKEGDSRSLLVRIASGFQRLSVQATVERLQTPAGEDAILFSVPLKTTALSRRECARQMLEGFDDPDTHMAVLGNDGEIIVASERFERLGITEHTAHSLVTMVSNHPDRLMKRPIPTGRGYLPAAVGKLSEEPGLHLLFVVEMVIGNLDPTEDFSQAAPIQPVVEAIEDETHAPAPRTETVPETEAEVPALSAEPGDDYTAAIDAISTIEEVEDLDDMPDTAAAPKDIETNLPAEPSSDLPDADLASVIEDAEPAPMELADEGDVSSSDAAADTETVQIWDPQPEEAPVAFVTEASEQADVAPAAQGAFVFNPQARATRFVWKIDAEGRFNEVSNEFAKAVGPHASSINGVAFTDIAHLFNLDPDGKIAELLGKRDTWSGKTIHWPIEGTALKVPVDLAALPTYTRNREFDGFRGFGIVRLADAVSDPLELGLSLAAGALTGEDITAGTTSASAEEATAQAEAELQQAAAADPEETDAATSVSVADAVLAADAEDDSGTVLPADAGDAPDDENEPGVDQPDGEKRDETSLMLPWGERPALRLVETPNRRHSDKVIRLEERRSRGRDGLSPVEQAAFREIARQLQPLNQAGESEAAQTPADDIAATKTAAETTPIDDQNTPQPTVDDAAFPAPFAEEQPVEDEAVASNEDESEEADSPDVFADVDGDIGQRDAEEQQADDDTAEETPLDVLASLIPPRAQMEEGLSAGAIDQMPVALLVHAGDELIHANPEFLRLTGYDTLAALEEVGGLDSLLQRQDLDEDSGQPGGLTLVRSDDLLVPVMARLQSIRWEQGNALMLALMPLGGRQSFATTTVAEVEEADGRQDRMRARLARVQGELEELRSILETATDGVVILGHDGEIRSMNRSANALFNYDNEETQGKPFVMLFAHESQKSVMDYLAALAGHGVASVLNDGREVIGREASGGFIPLFMTMGRLTSSEGYCAVIRDITQWKRTEEELRNAKRAAETANAHKSEFLARVSHEIRTPLNAIIGFSDMMATERFGAIGHPRYIEYANDIGRSGRHVLDIVNDLLDISKIEAGEMDLDFIAVGLNETLSEAVALIQPQANSQRVIIRTALSQSVPHVVADLRSIKQIALNILSNAIRFTPAGGQIVVSTSYETNGSVVLRIRDTGVGMTRSELEQAMKPFRQVATTSSRKRGDGTGLGLPLTKAMVDANRAQFSISSAPNEGTLVEIIFPSPRVLAN
ncbi:PAS domain S-box protein [Rhizobium sp. LjRoot30]|uniref:PAS domain-containing sensor histidine kinase n=1 Tax=Rhizobium sp. LjRoot30 TaxID=3342320 RepID=UPI003ECDE0CE